MTSKKRCRNQNQDKSRGPEILKNRTCGQGKCGADGVFAQSIVKFEKVCSYLAQQFAMSGNTPGKVDLR